MGNARPKLKSPFTGRWRIVSMSAWDEDFIDEEEEGFFEFDEKGSGEFHFGYVHGRMDGRLSTRDGELAVEWTWDGNDEMDPAQGRGWAVVKGDELHGMIYDHLTAEERARLIFAAGARGDEAEQKRLIAAGERITLSMQDHAPFAHAFNELAMTQFLRLLEVAANYLDAFTLLHEFEDTDTAETEDAPEPEDGEDAAAAASTDASEADAADSEQSGWEQCFQLVLAQGFTLKTWADGWRRFCESLGVPPFRLWQHLPGFERLQRALGLAERAAFVPEGMIRWLNDNRSEGTPEIGELSITPEGIAGALEAHFRERAAWWGG